jgi:putative transposase
VSKKCTAAKREQGRTIGWERSVKRKRHSAPEIVAKLRQADQMAAEGRLQGDIARALGVSVMTYHRWRSGRPMQETARPVERRDPRSRDRLTEQERAARVEELQLENSRLRRMVTDLLLEKAKLEDEL